MPKLPTKVREPSLQVLFHVFTMLHLELDWLFEPTATHLHSENLPL